MVALGVCMTCLHGKTCLPISYGTCCGVIQITTPIYPSDWVVAMLARVTIAKDWRISRDRLSFAQMRQFGTTMAASSAIGLKQIRQTEIVVQISHAQETGVSLDQSDEKSKMRLITIGAALICSTLLGCEPRPDQPPVASSTLNTADYENLEKAASKGDAAAQYSMSVFAATSQQRQEWLDKSVRQGYEPATLAKGSYLLEMNDQKQSIEGLKILEALASRGNIAAMAAIVGCQQHGNCSSMTNQTALGWALLAQETSLLHKQENLAASYLTALNSKMPEDEKKRAAGWAQEKLASINALQNK
jgi:hypothetical protein